MKTRRLLSNISFNTAAYFKSVAGVLVKDRYIDWCYWIVHEADTDDKKKHIHFVFQPSRSIDTAIFNSKFNEWEWIISDDLEQCKVMNYRPLKPTLKYQYCISLDDWFLYCKHDYDYLNAKGLTRNYAYNWEDFRSTDTDSLEHDINNIDFTKVNRMKFLKEGVMSSVPFAVLVQNGKVPIQWRQQYEKQYEALRRYLRARGDIE